MDRNELRHWRLERKLSPGGLATGLKVDRNTVYRWESGHLPLPPDLESRLAAFLLSLDRQAAEDATRPLHTEEDDQDFSAPHGEVIGLKRYFWREWTDEQRAAWIMDEKRSVFEAFRALPWPWWSHGWSHYPVSPDHYDKAPGPAGTPRPHYLAKWAKRVIRQHMSQDQSIPGDKRYRQAVLDLCRRDNPAWSFDRSIAVDDDLHTMVMEVTKDLAE